MAFQEKTQSRFTGRKMVIFEDLTLSVVASLLAILVVRWLTEPIPHFSSIVLVWVLCSLAGIVLGGLLSGLWKVDVRYLNLTAIGKVASAVGVKEVVLVIALLVGCVRLNSLMECFIAVAVDMILSAFVILAPRFFLATLRQEERMLSRSLSRQTALVMGWDAASVALAKSAEESGRYYVVGFLTSNKAEEGRVVDNRIVFFFEDTDDLLALQWRLGGIDCILFPMDWNNHPEHRDRISGKGAAQADDQSDSTPPDRSKMTLAGYAFKRSFDIGLSGALLLIFSPLMALCALAIKMEDHGPAIYRQERIGKGGKPFNILKFRSMRTDAEAAGCPALYGGDNDPRLTKVGKFLRQHHLDELPQLWNVFRGDMSFIGYRPERQFYISQIMERNPRYKYLYLLRPGVTSYATLYNGYTDTLEKMLTRLDLDLYYLRNHSVLFDVKVLGLTFLRIVTGKVF